MSWFPGEKAPIFQQDESEIRKRLWGDHFHDSEIDEWTEKHTGAASCVPQSYCVENLYKGPGDDDYAQGIRNCDTRAPLMLYVSKMIPTHVKGEFFAYGRVFSGIVGNGSRVRIMGPNDVHGEEHIKTVQRAVVWMENKLVTLESVPCGNTVAVFGLDEWTSKNVTLTTEERLDAHSIHAIKFSASPFVVVVVDCKDRVKLRKGLECLVKSDLSVVCTSTKDKTQFFIVVVQERGILKYARKI
ncbi:elongation factor 2 [Tanacetum coccineum]